MRPIARIAAACWRWPSGRKWIGGVLAGVALYALGGFLLVPALVKWQLVKQLPGLAHRHASVRQVRCSPFALSLTVRGLALTDRSTFLPWC